MSNSKSSDPKRTAEYKKELISSINALIKFRYELFGAAVNLAMLRDLREINEAFEVGDTYKFELSHLKNSSDSNVNKLIFLIEEIQDTVDSLININAIDEDQISWEEDQDDASK